MPDSVISQAAFLQVHCAGKGDNSGHVRVDPMDICVPVPFPAPTRHPARVRRSPGLHELRGDAPACARPLLAEPVCGAYLHSLLTARNAPLIMHLWNSAVWEPSNYPTVASPAPVSSRLGFIKSPTRAGVVCCRLYIFFFI